METPVYFSIYHMHHHFTGGTNDGTVQMPAEHFALFIARTHMQMAVKFVIHCADGSCQGNDFKVSAEIICHIPFFPCVKYAYRKSTYRPQRIDTGQRNLLPLGNLPYLFENLFPRIYAGNQIISKPFVFQNETLLSSLYGIAQ